MLRNFIENIKKKKDVKEIVDRNKYDIESTKGHLEKERLTMSKLTEMKETGIADIDFFKTWDKKYPVTHWECERAYRIEKVQGNTNKIVKDKCQDKGLYWDRENQGS